MKVHISYSKFIGEPEYRHYKTSKLIFKSYSHFIEGRSSYYVLLLLFKNVVVQILPQQIVKL